MRRTSLDCETFLIAPGMLAPKLVCVSVARSDGYQELTKDVLVFREYLEGSDLIVGQNISFDFGVACAEDSSLIPLVFQAYEDGRVGDTMIRAQLIDIRNGELKYRWEKLLDGSTKRVETNHHLAELSKRYLGKHLPKADTWRLRYSELSKIPISEWPPEAKSYAQNDAIAALEVYEAQEKLGPIANEREQAQASWALHLMSLWGVRTDPVAVSKLKEKLENQLQRTKTSLRESGIFRADGTKDVGEIRRRVNEAYQGNPPRTPAGSIKTDEDTKLQSGDPVLIATCDVPGNLLNTFVPVLERGNHGPFSPRYNVLVTSGRVSCREPNMTNLPTFGGVRECFVARPGYLLAVADYATLELRTLAKTCLRLGFHSELAEVLRRGEDPHLNLAAQLLHISKEEAKRRKADLDPEVLKTRQLAKIAVFGFPGGMGSDTFVDHARENGFIITKEESRVLRETWFKTFPEMRKYFAHVSSVVGSYGNTGTFTQAVSGRVRSGCKFTDGANSGFQDPASDIAKLALWRVSKECYVDRRSPLFGARLWAFIHDELIVEAPEAIASEAAERMALVMVEAGRAHIDDIPFIASPVLTRRWYKGAEPVRKDGALVPCKPLEENGRTVWVEDF